MVKLYGVVYRHYLGHSETLLYQNPSYKIENKTKEYIFLIRSNVQPSHWNTAHIHRVNCIHQKPKRCPIKREIDANQNESTKLTEARFSTRKPLMRAKVEFPPLRLRIFAAWAPRKAQNPTRINRTYLMTPRRWIRFIVPGTDLDLEPEKASSHTNAEDVSSFVRYKFRSEWNAGCFLCFASHCNKCACVFAIRELTRAFEHFDVRVSDYNASVLNFAFL